MDVLLRWHEAEKLSAIPARKRNEMRMGAIRGFDRKHDTAVPAVEHSIGGIEDFKVLFNRALSGRKFFGNFSIRHPLQQ